MNGIPCGLTHKDLSDSRDLPWGIQIYNYCIKYNIPVPDHFMQYVPRNIEDCID